VSRDTTIRFVRKTKKSRNSCGHFGLNNEIHSFERKIWTKTRDLDEMLDDIGDFGRRRNDILDKIFLVSPNMLVAQYKISADIKTTLTSQ